MKELKYNDLDFFTTEKDDLLAVDKNNKEKRYLLSIFNCNFLNVSKKDIASRNWIPCNKDKVLEIIEYTKAAIIKREQLNNPDKVHNVDWWDDPDDYYFGNDTYKLSFKFKYGFNDSKIYGEYKLLF